MDPLNGRDSSLRMVYAGEELIPGLVSLAGGPDSLTDQALLRRAEHLAEAVTRGLRLTDSLALVGELFEHLDAVLPPPPDCIETWKSDPWARSMLNALELPALRELVPCLPEAQAIQAWSALDSLYALAMAEPSDPGVFENALIFLASLGVPGPRTVARLSTPAYVDTCSPWSEQLGGLIENAVDWATTEDDLAALIQAGFGYGIQYAQELSRLDDRGSQLLAGLDAFNGDLSVRYGGEVFCADLSATDEQALSQAEDERRDLLQQLDVLSIGLADTHFSQGLKRYISGRIRMATGDLAGARTEFESAFSQGFAPWLTGTQLAFALSRMRLRSEARDWIEKLAVHCLLPRGALYHRNEALSRLYFQMGGNPDVVGLADFLNLSPRVEKQRRRRQRFAFTLAAKTEEARLALKRRWTEQAESFISGLLTHEDIDSSLTNDAGRDRYVQIDRSDASKIHLDELPALGMPSGLLVRAVERGVGAVELAAAFLVYVQGQLDAGTGLEQLLMRFGCLSKSSRFAQSQLDDALVQDDGAPVMAALATNGQLDVENLGTLFSRFFEHMETRGNTTHAVELGERLASGLPEKEREPFVQTILPWQLKQLSECGTVAEQMEWVDRILRSGTALEWVHTEILKWAMSSLREPGSNRIPRNDTTLELLRALSSRLEFAAGETVRSSLCEQIISHLDVMEWSRDMDNLLDQLFDLARHDRMVEQKAIRWFRDALRRAVRPWQRLKALDTANAMSARLPYSASAGIRDALGTVLSTWMDADDDEYDEEVATRLQGMLPEEIDVHVRRSKSTKANRVLIAMVVMLAIISLVLGVLLWKSKTETLCECKAETAYLFRSLADTTTVFSTVPKPVSSSSRPI